MLVTGVGLIVISANPARATTIDFGSSNWNPGTSAASIGVGGYTVAATDPIGALLSWTSGLGFGVNSGLIDGLLGTADEVNGVEVLTVTLPTATTLAGFTVSNLYYESLLGLGLSTYQEIGYYRLGNGAWQSFTAPKSNTTNTDGLLYVGIAPTVVSTISFGYKSGLTLGDTIRNDFTVKSLDVVSTPEPASLMLLAAALGAAVTRARRLGLRQAR
jgi:hypothetical protein